MPTPAKKAPAKKAPAKKVAAKKAPAVPATPVKATARALSLFEEKFTKRFGEGSIRTPEKRKYRVVSTGSLTLDLAMGCGGWVVGRISEIWGPESVNKSTLCLIAVANFQREFPHKLVIWIDMERTLDETWAEKLGVDLSRMRIEKPHSSEDVSDMARMSVESGLFSLVVLDSVGGMVTEEEMEKEAGKSAMGTAAQVMTRMVKQCAVLCDDTQTTLIIVNQVRANMSHGADTTTAGGFALKHVTTHKIRLRRTSAVPYTVGKSPNEEYVGFEVAAHVEKNKVAPPRKVGVFAVFNQDTPEYGPLGIDRAREAFEMGKRTGVIAEPSLGYFLLPGEEKAIHGQPQTLARLRQDAPMMDKIRREMLLRIADDVSTEVGLDEVVDDETPDVPSSDDEETLLDFAGTSILPTNVNMLDLLRDDERSVSV